MAQILNFPGDRPGMNNEEKAQDMVYDALESDSPVQRKRLARKAIELDPFCADAYCVLAEEYESIEKEESVLRKESRHSKRNMEKSISRRLQGICGA
jgi:hypothetical protein